MILFTSVLFVAAMAGGGLQMALTKPNQALFRLSLIFAGAFLFSITLVHIIPELFANGSGGMRIGVFILAGYVLQQILEYFTAGAEHGHIHLHGDSHQHSPMLNVSVMMGLSLHAFLEGAMLTHPHHLDQASSSWVLLMGIVLHKAPAAFALISVLACTISNRAVLLLLLSLFAMASPLGFVFGNSLLENEVISPSLVEMLFAVVAGGFLQISTTIVFESSPGHKFEPSRFVAAALGVLLAIGAASFM